MPEAICTTLDSLGKYPPEHKLTDESLETTKNHINSYHPPVSQYRREHALLWRYLSPDLTLLDMYKDFNSKFPNVCKKERYRETVKSMNISFVKLGEEECDEHWEHAVHKETHPQQGNDDEPPAINTELKKCCLVLLHLQAFTRLLIVLIIAKIRFPYIAK